MVVRTLVQSKLAFDPSLSAEAADRARYIHLLSTRSKLPLVQVRRLDLASWLSFMDKNENTTRSLIANNRLENILCANGGPANDIEQAIFYTVLKYQHVQRAYPQVLSDFRRLHKMLCEDTSHEETVVVNRFIRILQDEKFMDGKHVFAGYVLIVDPEEMVSPVLSSTLTAEGFDVEVFPYSDEVMEHIKNKKPDIIISEIKLPIKDGCALCRDIKNNPDTANIPIFITTSARGRTKARECLKYGAEEVLLKPVDAETLLIKIQRILSTTKHPPVSSQPPEGITGNLTDISFADIIQIMSANNRNMLITIKSETREGTVYIKYGQVVHAIAGNLTGEKAFYEIMSWKEGTFRAQNWSDFPTQSINSPIMSLLMEGARLSDESGMPPK